MAQAAADSGGGGAAGSPLKPTKAALAAAMRGSFPQGLTLEHVSPATRLLEKRRQMFEVQEALEAQKGDFGAREEGFRRREEALRRRDLELQESLIKFNKFLQENENKRARAIKRVADERKQREAKEGEIGRLKAQYLDRLDEEARLKEELETHRRYQDYLYKVVEAATDDYPEVPDLLNRFRTLREANAGLTHAAARNEAETEALREEYAAYVKARTNEMLDGNNQLSGLQKELERGSRESYLVQADLDLRIRSMSDRALELGQILGAIANVLDRCERGSALKRSSAAAAGGGSGGGGGGGSGGSGLSLEAEGRLAIDRLEEVATYMVDYASVVEDYAELEKRGA